MFSRSGNTTRLRILWRLESVKSKMAASCLKYLWTYKKQCMFFISYFTKELGFRHPYDLPIGTVTRIAVFGKQRTWSLPGNVRSVEEMGSWCWLQILHFSPVFFGTSYGSDSELLVISINNILHEWMSTMWQPRTYLTVSGKLHRKSVNFVKYQCQTHHKQ